MSKRIFNIVEISNSQIESIYKTIDLLRNKKQKRDMARWFISSVFSAVISVMTVIQVGVSMKNAGIAEYVLMMTSDTAILSLYWKDAVLAITDSLPLLGTIIFLAFSAVSVGAFMQYKKINI